MRKQNVQATLAEVNWVLGFKLALEYLELQFCFYTAVENYEAVFFDVQIILTLSLNYKVFEGPVTASQLLMSVRAHVES